MDALLDLLILLAGFLAAAAVALGCGVGLVVWFAGRRRGAATEAWPAGKDR